MQVRDDVDMQFANIFKRMMAKSPKERYASLDEVIEDLGEYASKTDTPLWLAEFTQQPAIKDQSTVSGGSTAGPTVRILAIDFGMFYSATAEASPGEEIKLLPAGGPNNPLFRMAVASDQDDELVYGNAAMERRDEHPHGVLTACPCTLARPIVEREIAGRQCPPKFCWRYCFDASRRTLGRDRNVAPRDRDHCSS